MLLSFSYHLHTQVFYHTVESQNIINFYVFIPLYTDMTFLSRLFSNENQSVYTRTRITYIFDLYIDIVYL